METAGTDPENQAAGHMMLYRPVGLRERELLAVAGATSVGAGARGVTVRE
jgi:hypothetical protein